MKKDFIRVSNFRKGFNNEIYNSIEFIFIIEIRVELETIRFKVEEAT